MRVGTISSFANAPCASKVAKYMRPRSTAKLLVPGDALVVGDADRRSHTDWTAVMHLDALHVMRRMSVHDVDAGVVDQVVRESPL